MITVFLKFTVRPWPSVSRPSSSTCRSTLKTSGCAFSISSRSTTRVGLAPHRLGELPALLVADIAGRGADEPRHRVLLHVLGHVEADHVVLVVEERRGQRPRQLGLADAGGPEEEERADRALGSLMPARARITASATARTASSWPTTRWCSSSSRRRSFCISPSISFETGMPVHRETTSAMSSSSTSSLISRRPPAAARASSSSQLALERGQGPVLQLGHAVQVVGARRLLDLDLHLLDALAGAGAAARWPPSRAPTARAASWPGPAGPSAPSRASARRSRDAASVSFFSASRSISSCRMRRVISSSSAGIESISVRSRAAASSTRSMALSGRNRSAM